MGMGTRLGSGRENNQDPTNRLCHVWGYQPYRFCLPRRPGPLSRLNRRARVLRSSRLSSGSLLLAFRAALNFPLQPADFPLLSLLFYGEESLD
jgi:hypothetical protein